MGGPPKFDERSRKAAQTVQVRVTEMQGYTDRICNQLNMSAAARTAAERAYKSCVCGRKLLVFARHSDEQCVFLRMMIRLALATEPSLIPKADEVARYCSANYGFEWVNSEITATVREEAKAAILSVGDSSYGETGAGAAFAYVRCHYHMLRFDDLGDYGKTYVLAARLQGAGEFNNSQDEWRKALGYDRLRARRDGLLGRDDAGQDGA